MYAAVKAIVNAQIVSALAQATHAVAKTAAAQERRTVIALVKKPHQMWQPKSRAAAKVSVCVRTASALAQAILAIAKTAAAQERQTVIALKKKAKFASQMKNL